MSSKREAITQRAMFMKELNEALKLIKQIFKIENVDVVTDTAWDIALDLAIKIGFNLKWHYVLVIIGGWFIKAVAFLEWVEVKRFNKQFEKLSMIDGVNHTCAPLFTYLIEYDKPKAKPAPRGSGEQTNPDATEEPMTWRIVTDAS